MVQRRMSRERKKRYKYLRKQWRERDYSLGQLYIPFRTPLRRSLIIKPGQKKLTMSRYLKGERAKDRAWPV